MTYSFLYNTTRNQTCDLIFLSWISSSLSPGHCYQETTGRQSIMTTKQDLLCGPYTATPKIILYMMAFSGEGRWFSLPPLSMKSRILYSTGSATTYYTHEYTPHTVLYIDGNIRPLFIGRAEKGKHIEDIVVTIIGRGDLGNIFQWPSALL